MSASSNRRSTSGDEIRAKIEANRQKRLGLSEAMKREAGVSEHWVNPHDNSGWARPQDRVIYAPEGRNIILLTTVAHECGHAFLHHIGNPGVELAPHVKEMEAESYAHQAMQFHGMKIPSYRTAWGRQYVASWIAKDEACGMPIDPRVRDYVAGRRSPFEPLRMVPATWLADSRGPRPAATPALQPPSLQPLPRAVLRPAPAPTRPPSDWVHQFKAMAARSLTVAAVRSLQSVMGQIESTALTAFRRAALTLAHFIGIVLLFTYPCFLFGGLALLRTHLPKPRILEPGVFAPDPYASAPAIYAGLLTLGVALAGFCWAFSEHGVTLHARLRDAEEFLRHSLHQPARRLTPFIRWRSAGKALLTGAGLASLFTALAHHGDWFDRWGAAVAAMLTAAVVWPVLGILAAEALFLPSEQDRARLKNAIDRDRELLLDLERIKRQRAAEQSPPAAQRHAAPAQDAALVLAEAA